MYDDAVKNKMFWNATPSFQEFQRRLQNPKYVQTVQANYRAHGRSGDAFDTLSGFRDYFCVSDEDKQDMTQGVGNMIADTKARLAGQQRYNKLKQHQDKQRGIYGRLDLGVKNPLTNDNVVREPLTGRYLTSDGAEYAQEFEAARAQNHIDETSKRYTEAVERGDIPSAFEVRDKDGNYALMEDLGVKPGVHVTEKGKQQQLAGLVNTRKSVEEQYNALYRKLEKDFKRSAPFSLNTHSQYGIDDNDMRLQAYLNSNAQYRRLKAQLHQLDNAIGVGKEAVKGRAEERYVKNAKGMLGYAYRDLKTFGASALRGLWNAVSDVSTWDMGLQDLQDNMTLYTTVKKARQKGYKNLNSEERQMLDVAAKTGAYTAENQQYLGRGYKAGNVTGESLPFMVEMALNPASGLGEAAMSKYMRNAIAKYGKEAVRKEAWKYVTKKCGYRIAGDVLGAALMTGTTGSARTLADTYDRLTGDIKSTYDSNGKIVYDGTENEETGILKAYLKAFGATAIENHSEFVGEYFNPLLKGAGTLTMKGWKKVNAKSANAFLDNLKDMGSTSTAKWLGNLFEKTQWHGTIGEYAEEVVGNIENALLVGDSTLDAKEGTGVFNLDQNIDTFLGVSLMGGFFSTLKTGAYIRDKVKGERKILMQQSLDLDNSIRYALGADPRLTDKWKEWRVALAQGTDEEKKQALKEISENTNGNIKKAMYDYSANAQKLAGMDKATQGAIEDGTITPEQAQRDADIEQAHEEGLAAEGTARHDIQQEHQLRENSLARMLGISAEQLDRMEDEDIESMTGQNDALDTAIYDYQTSRERYQGVIDRATDEVEQAGIDAAHQIDLYTDHSTGQIRPCVIKGNNGKEDYQGYIVNGNIATHPDGAIDVSGSDKMILYFDPETGKIEHGDASTFASLGESADATVARQQAIDEAKQQAAQAQSRDIDGGVGEDGNVSEAMPTSPQSSDQEERNAADFDIGQVVNAETGEVIPVSFEGLAEGENAYLTGGRPDGKAKDRLKVTIVDAEGNVTNRVMKRGNVQVDGRMSAEDFRNAYEEAVSSRIAPEADMNGQENNVNEEGVVAGDAVPSADRAATSEEEGAASEPAVRDKNGNPIYDKMPISATIADLYDGALDDAEIDGFVSAQIAEAEKAVEKMEKKKPKVGTDKAKYLADKKAWEEGLQEAQRKVQYWQDVKAEVEKITTPEDARGYEEELNGDAAQTAYRNGSDAAAYGAREVTAEFMQSGDVKITPESYRKETGFGAAEQRAMVGKISKGGKSIDKLAEDLEVFDRENYNGMYFGGDSSVAKDAILDYLSSPDSRKGVKKMQSEAEREYVEAYEAERDRYYQEKYHMSYEEYLVYSSQEMPELLRKYSNFDEQLFLERYADEIEAALQKREEQLKQEENGKEGNVSAGEESGHGRSNRVQSGERTYDTGRGEVGKDSAGEVGPRHEGVVESEAALGSGGSTNQQRIGRVQKETRADVADQTMTHDEAIAFIAAMENRAEVAPSVDLSIENWDSLFGLDGIVNTPIGKVKMGDNQFTKMMREDRHGKLGMVKPTLENPDAILEDASKAKAGDTEERPSSYIFVKAFKKSDGSRYYYFTSITVSKDGLEVVVSNQEKRKNAIANLLSKDKLVWKHADDVSDASDVAQGLYSSQGNVSDLATEGTDAPQTSMSNNDPTSSESKDTNNTDTKQENGEKSVGGEKEPMSPTPAMIDRMIAEQRVDDVSELLISSELKKAAEGIAEAFGMKVVYLKKVFIKSNDPAVEDFDGNGFVRNGVIYLSLKEADIAQFTFGHELLHQLKQIDADSYMRIRQKVIDVMGRKAFEMEVKARQVTYANVPGYTLYEDYAEEVIADTLGDIITHTDMLPDIARSLKDNPSLLDRFLKVVDNVRQYFRGKIGGALGDLVNDIRDTYEMTARQGAETNRMEAALDAVNDRFNDRLESLVANPNQKDRVLRLGRSSEFLRDGGLADAEIVLEFDKLARKSKEGYKNEHPFDMSDIKDLPKAIASPIAVFGNTSGENDGNVILTELKKDGKNFIVAVKTMMQPRKGGVVLEVNQITSLFPKDAKGIVHWFNSGKATNIDKEKALRFIEALPNHPGTTIKAEELISAANVVKDFETAKESEEKDRQRYASLGVSRSLGKEAAEGEPRWASLGLSTPLKDKIAAASADVDTDPTEAQKEAGNYKKGHVKVGMFDITIEQPQGSVRKGTDADGKQWESKMNNTYGYIRGAVGVDGDHIDVFLSNNIDGWDGRKVFVVDQYNPDGSFDEHKVMLGFNDADEAKGDYLANYEEGWENGRRIDVSAVNLEDFEKWIASSKRKTKPFSEYKNVKSESAESPKTGAFGTVYTQFRGKAQEAIAFLLEKKEGEAVGALHHKDIGDIDLVWGKEGTAKSDGFGLAKLAKYHPEVLGNLQEILDAMVVVKRTDNRVQLESETHQASVRLTWDSEKKNWLLTAFEKKNSVSDNTTDTVGTAEGGKRNDTATPQNTVSEGKDTEKVSSGQEDGEKSVLSDLEREFQKALEHEEDVEQKWEDKIQDYVAEHYPTQATVSAATTSAKGVQEREAMKSDHVLRAMREKADAEYKEARDATFAAQKEMETAKESDGKDRQLYASLGVSRSLGEEAAEGEPRWASLGLSTPLKITEHTKFSLKDNQGNPLNQDGTLKLDKIKSVDDLTDEDFLHPTRNVELPSLPKKIADAIGTEGRPVVIKKNIFERNYMRHKDVTPELSKIIFKSALYNPDLYGQNQKKTRPYNWVLINTKDEKGNNRTVLLEVNPNKDNVEIVHWHFVNDKNLGLIKKQAIREGDQVLILPSEQSEEVGGLSNLTDDLSAANVDNSSETAKESEGKDRQRYASLGVSRSLGEEAAEGEPRWASLGLSEQQLAERQEVNGGTTLFSLKKDRTLAGVHNITEEKLLKAIKQGGLANPSVAVIDSSKQNHDGYGDISLILPSDKVAKRTGKNAGTWQGDAWTPTYPQVERQMSNKGAEKSSNDVGSVPGDMYSEVRRGLDRWLDGGEENSAMAYMFLHEKGVAPEPKKIQPKFSDEAYNELKSITAGNFNIYGIGKADARKVLDMYIDAKFDGDKDLYEEKTKAWLERNKSIVDAGANGGMRYAIAKENVELYDEYGFNYKGVQTFVRDVEYDHRKTGVDMNATLNEVEDYIKTNNLTDEFNTWMEGKEKEYGIKEVIFDGFTPSGNRRYVPNTLENVSKIMKKQGRNGSTGISVSFQNFAARLMPSYGTLKDIRSKKGLLTSDREKFDNFREKWSNVFFELGMKCQPDATGTFDDYGLARLSEAAMASDPQAYLKKEYNVDFSDEDTKRLKEMVKAIKEESPAMYFETKFERPVHLDEFAAAVVPTTASNEVKQALQNAGVQIYEYDKEKEGDRSCAFNEAINSSDNIRFSLDKDKGTVVSPSKPSKAEAVLRDAVIDRLRENGMEVITDVAEGQKVLDEANGKGKLQMGDAPETFAERQKLAVENRGVVMPGLNETYVEVVKDIPRHGYTGTIAEATKQAIQKAKEKYVPEGKVKVLHYDNNGAEFDYVISGNAIEICLSPKHQAKSGNKGVHLALAEHLDEVINKSVEVEEHPDYIKGKDGKRGEYINPNAIMHRFYGVAIIDGVPCRIMTLMREDARSEESNGIHSYEVQKIEMLDNELPSISNGVGTQINELSAYPLAKLLKGVEKAYDKGKYLLEESEKRSAGLREQRMGGADGLRFFRTANGEAYGFTVGGKIYVDPRIATSETPVHEYAHLWASALRSGNKEEWQNVVGLMKDSKVWDEVKKRYPELKTDDEIADEVIATYSGRRGAERLREEQRKIAEGNGGVFEKAEAISALEKVKRALKMFWKGVADFLHIHYKSAEEVADRVMKDLLEGVDPRKMGEDVDRQRYASLGVSRSLGEEAAEGEPRWASLGLSEQQLDGDDTIRFSLRQEPAPKVTKKGYAVFIYKKLKNGGYKLVPKMLSNDPGAPAQTWLNADTGYMKRDENGEPLQNTNGRASVSVNGSQAGGNKSNKLAWRPGKHLAMYPNASQFKSPDGTIPKDVIFFEVEYAADPDLHKQYQRNAWELGMNDNGQYRNNQGGLPYIPKDSYYLYRTNSISEGATPMIITGAYKINRALTDAEAKELNQNAGGMWCPRKGGNLTEEKLKDMGLDDKGLKKMTESFDMDTIKESHDESDEARLLPGYKSREINWEDKDLIHSIEENGQNINDYRDGYVAPEHSEEPTIRFSLDKDKGTVVSPSKPSKAEAVLRDAVIDRLRENGMEVITDVAEGQKVLDEANGEDVMLSAKQKRALETATMADESTNKATVVSSADGAKVQNNLEILADSYKNRPNKAKGFITDLSRSLGLEQHEASQYGTFVTENGKTVTIRVSNHNARVSFFDKNGENDGISIVISNHKNKGLLNDGNAHIIEFFYSKQSLQRADSKPLSDIIRSVSEALYSGEFKDTTGLAERQEVNAKQIREQRMGGADGLRFFRTANGEAYGFTVGGKIYVDPRIATSETPVHEYAHLWASALRSGNKEEWQNVVGLMKDSKVWDEVKKRYPELKTDDEIADEVIATYSGRRGAERLREEQRKIAEGNGGVFEKAEAISALEKVKRALKMFWKGVADFLHIHYKSAEEVADRVMKDLLEGVDPRMMGNVVDGVSNQQTLRNVNNQSLFDAIHTLYSKGKTFAEKIYKRKFFDVAETPDFMKRLGLTGDKFTIRYGVISRHFGKDNQHDFTEEEWKQMPKALSNPILITEYYQDDQQKRQKGYRLYTPLKLADGSYAVVSAEVKNAGKNLEINAINTIFGRNAVSDIHDRIVYQNPKITLEQMSLLGKNNPHQYPSDQELSDANVDNSSETAKEYEGKDRQRYVSLGVSRALGEEAGEGEPRWASWSLSEQQLDGDDTVRFSLNYDKWDREMASWLKRNRLPKNAQRPVVPQREVGESDLHFAGRLAKYNQDKALWNTAPKYEGHLSSGMTARGEFNYELQRGSVLTRIAVQDSMLAIRKAQEAIARHSGLLKVGTFEDAYMAENNSHGKAKNEFEQYDQEYLAPLRKWFNVMMKRLDGSYNNVTNYMIAKHGLERNAHMAFMAALEAEAKKAIDNTQPDAKRLRAQMVHDAYKQYKADSRRLINDADYQSGKYDYAQWRRTDDAIRKSYCSNYESFRYNKGGVVRDYAGLSSLFQNETDFEEKAAELCADIESKNGHETGELWDAVRQATRQILKNSHDAGMMSDETYDYVRGMYEHYVPLRGWNDSAADEVWDYAGGGRGVFNAALKEAHGRQSLADDPVAYIMNMAESGFLVNNKNWVKQHFLMMAMNHPTDLLTVSKAWYVKTKDQFGNEVWIPASPNIPADETDPAVIQAALDAFQTKMEQMEQSGDATQQRGSLNIEYPQTKMEEREHEVRVMKDGEEYVIYVNGDPQLAQALNNTRAMRVREHEGLFEKACAWLGRKMAAVYTSLSPLFVPSNWARDTTMTLASTAIREDARYNWLLRTKFMRPDVQMRMFGLVKEYQNGKLREKVKSNKATKTEKNFWNFMINGGETGFVSTMDVDAFRNKIQRDLKDMGRTRLNPVKVGHIIADSVEYINRVIEDSNRFAIYQTSIEYGRGIEEAVQDAKNVTLNFNRKGTGEMGMSAIRQLFLFINPAIQSLQTLGALAKEHKAKFTAVTSAWMASGMLVPLFNELMFNLASAAAGGGGDDDDEFNPKDEYWKFSSFDRRNNCILWIPFTHNFIKIPLAQEFRGFYGIGDMVASAMWGGENAKESWSNYAADLMGQIIDLSPLDPVSYDGNVLVSLMPNAIRPLVEIAQNVTFTGKPIYRESDFNKYDPSFKKAYAGTPDFLLRYSKWMNSIGNKYPEAQQGPVEQTAVGRYANNPAVIDHLLKSYLGGMYTLGSQIAGAITKASDEETRKDFKTADIPFFSKFVANPNDRPQSKNKGDAYWQDFEKYQRSSHTLGVIRQDARKTGNFSVLEDFYKSEEYKEMKEYEPKAKQRKEEQKYEKWKEEGNADLYQPHQQTGEDVYKRHSTPADDFEDTKASILYQKIKPAKDIFDLADINTPSGMDTFNKYYDLAGKVEEAHSVKKEMNAIVKSFVNDEHKATFDPEKMKEYRALRKQYLQLVEDGNRMFEKIKAQRN